MSDSTPGIVIVIVVGVSVALSTLVGISNLRRAENSSGVGVGPSSGPPPVPDPPPFNPQPPANQPPNGPPIRPGPPQPTQGPIPTRPFDVDPVVATAGQTVYLSVFTPFDFQNEFTTANLGVLAVQKKQSQYGIRMHPGANGPSAASYALGKQFKRLKGHIGLGDWDMNPKGPVIFTVSGDGRQLGESAPIGVAGTAVPFDVDVTGVTVLTLATRFQRNGTYSHVEAGWFDPWLER